MEREELIKLVDDFAAKLGEHFDCVQILASRMYEAESGSTERVFSGVGNWYGRQGMAHAFIKLDDASEIGSAVGSHLKEE